MGTIMVRITQAKLALVEGLPQVAITNLEGAARLQHNMPYMEPEVFYTPGTCFFFPSHGIPTTVILTTIFLLIFLIHFFSFSETMLGSTA